MPSLWSEHRTSEGRLYWSHAETKQSVWEKPDELRTPFEKELAKTDWKQYTTKDKPYYVNSVTKETKWELPEELQAMKKRLESQAGPTPDPAASASPATPADRTGSTTPSNPAAHGTVALVPPNVPGRTFLPLYPTTMTRFSPSSVPTGPKRELPPKWPVGGFLTHDKAEDAFFKLLKYEGVDENSTWEDTMRKIITHELYKALDTLAMKKAAFVKYQHKIVQDRQAAKDSRVARMRPVLRSLFESRPEEIKAWSTVKTANRIFESERQWRTAFEDEREAILAEYTRELREKEETEERELKQRNITKLAELVRTLDTIHIGTRWRQAHDIVVSSESFKSDDELQKIDTIDMMGVYDDYMRHLEGGQEEDARRYRVKMARVARKARDGYRALMAEMADKGELTMESKWKDVYDKVKDDARYQALLGQPGSGPLELWMDAVDDLAEETYLAADKVDKAFKEYLGKERVERGDGAEASSSSGAAANGGAGGESNGDSKGADDKMDVDGNDDTTPTEVPGRITLQTPFATFQTWLTLSHLSTQLAPLMQRRVYDMHISRLRQQAADEARRAERKRRHRIDDLRYALKGVSRHIDLDMSYEEATPFMEGLKEWQEVGEEGRREAFERFVRRQKEKLEERDRYEKRHSKSRYSEEYEERRPSKSTRYGDEREGGKERVRGEQREKERESERDGDRDRSRDRRGGKGGGEDEEGEEIAGRVRDRDGERESKRPKLSYKDIEEGEI